MRLLLAALPLHLVSLDEAAGGAGAKVEIVEDGATFLANALKKATTVARALALPALADDSGLEVDALDGRPGIYSARFAGAAATDGENNQKLLHELDVVQAMGAAPRGLDGVVRWTARFRCALVLVDPIAIGAPLVAEGACEGEILRDARGESGFGYDPIFAVSNEPASGSNRTDSARLRTFAELHDAEKNRRSHRAKAVAAIVPMLRRWLGLGDEG